MVKLCNVNSGCPDLATGYILVILSDLFFSQFPNQSQVRIFHLFRTCYMPWPNHPLKLHQRIICGEEFDVFLTVHHSIDLFQVTKLMHTSVIL